MQFEASLPLGGVLLVSPAVSMLLERDVGGFRERRDRSLFASSLERIAALPGQLAIFLCFRSRLGQRAQAQATEADVASLALDDRAENPPFCTGRVDDEVQSVAVAVAAGLGDAV